MNHRYTKAEKAKLKQLEKATTGSLAATLIEVNRALAVLEKEVRRLKHERLEGFRDGVRACEARLIREVERVGENDCRYGQALEEAAEIASRVKPQKRST